MQETQVGFLGWEDPMENEMVFLERDRDKKETWGKLMTFETLDSIVPITKDKQEMVRKNGLPPKISPLLLFNCSAVSNSL